jgi:Golgi apparatus protein 1
MQQQQMRARVSGAVQQLTTACQDELRNFCGNVTPGHGRLLLCMQAHEDKISRQCELALLEVSRNIGKAVMRMETFAQACWPDIQVHCSGTGGSVMQCVIDNRSSLSAHCRAVVAATLPGAQPDQQPDQATPGQAPGQAPGQQPTMIGLAIHSADGMMLGHVTGLKRRPDGSLEAIEAELGTPLGLGATSVLISPSDLVWKGDGVELQMAAEQVRTVLQGQRR